MKPWKLSINYKSNTTDHKPQIVDHKKSLQKSNVEIRPTSPISTCSYNKEYCIICKPQKGKKVESLPTGKRKLEIATKLSCKTSFLG